MKGSLFATSLLLVATTVAAEAPARAAEPKFYFQIKEVTAAPDVDPAVKALAADALKAELAARPEWASDIGPTAAAPGADRSALAAELTKRKLRGFDVTVRIENFKQEMKDPRPGGRLKQLAVNVQLVDHRRDDPGREARLRGPRRGRASRQRYRKRGWRRTAPWPRRPPSRARSSRRSSRRW